jgi:phosphoribosylamine--glycine ligase
MDAIPALDEFGPPWVVKADGLAAGKGTTVTTNREIAEDTVRNELQRKSSRIVIEQYIDGWEASVLATVSANHIQWLMPIFQDYKQAYDNDTGPNTGGMGVYSPVPNLTAQVVDNIRDRILQPFVKILPEYGINFQGVVYLNAIIPFDTVDPYVLEFNARFGDPEAQGIFPLVKDGLAKHFMGIADNLTETPIPEVKNEASVVVVLASKGYPVNPSTGDKITIKPVHDETNLHIFHAGTGRSSNGDLVTAGGRILNVVATSDNVESARKLVYSTIKESIFFNGMHYRSDIGLSRVRRMKKLGQIQ